MLVAMINMLAMPQSVANGWVSPLVKASACELTNFVALAGPAKQLHSARGLEGLLHKLVHKSKFMPSLSQLHAH